METKGRVLIAGPTLGLHPDPDYWLPGLIRLMNNCRREGYEHACFFPYRQTWWPANNLIWDTAFKNKFDYILRFDDDIHGVNVHDFSLLLREDKDVIGGAYCNQRFPYGVNALVKSKEGNLIDFAVKGDLTLNSVEGYGYKGTDVKKVDLIGFGLTLMKVSAFKFIERPIYKRIENEELVPDDTYFAQLCADNNIEQYVHFGVRLKHRHVTLENAGYLFNSDAIERIEESDLKDK